MDYLLEGIIKALKMIISLDREMLTITLVSLKVSFISTLLATMAGIPFGFLVATREFIGKRVAVISLNTLMSIPTVVVGLMVYSFVSRRGPLGHLGLLYTQWAMIIGQCILIFPIVAALSLSATQAIDKRVKNTALTLGANEWQTAFIIMSEGRYAILAAIIAGFGRVFAEVGVSMMLGGNIKGYTRNITTAIAFETGKGEFELGLALGMILLTVAFSINILFHTLQVRSGK